MADLQAYESCHQGKILSPEKDLPQACSMHASNLSCSTVITATQTSEMLVSRFMANPPYA